MPQEPSARPAGVSIIARPSTSSRDALEIRRQVLARLATDAKVTHGSGRLKGKVVIITGVGPDISIGAATARVFAREGAAHLYLLDYSTQHLPVFAARLATDFPATKITHIIADAASASAISSVVARAMADEGRLDVFFANAGVTSTSGLGPGGAPRQIGEVEPDEFMEVMRINALSGFLAVKFAAPAMGKLCPNKGKTIPGGSIILTASVAGLRAGAGPAPYSASKAAAVSLAQTAALELAGSNVRVNALCPGLIHTAMTDFVFEVARARGASDRIGAAIPMRRQGVGHELAKAALYLASDESSYVNGTALVVDGGLVGPVVTAAPTPAKL
ncbi:hypothetical protein Q5752_006865 [Cryptotrichosporon argae]